MFSSFMMVLTNYAIIDFEKFVEHKSTCERGFQKRKRRFVVVDDSNPLPPDRQG
jgi:hypothetical protein